MNGRFKIYALICPFSKKIRYVGKSASYKTRFKQHCKDMGESSYKKKWIKMLAEKGLIPEFTILGLANTEPDARLLENEFCLKNIETIYNIFMPNKGAPTVSDYRKQNKITFDCEFKPQKFDTDKYNKVK